MTLSVVASTGVPETTTFSCRACDRQLEMQHRTRVGLNNHILLRFEEALRRDGDRVSPNGHRMEFKFSVIAGVLGLCPVRGLGLQRDVCALNGAVLRIVNDASNTSEYGRR